MEIRLKINDVLGQDEQFEKSKAYRRSIDFYRDILGIESEH